MFKVAVGECCNPVALSVLSECFDDLSIRAALATVTALPEQTSLDYASYREQIQAQQRLRSRIWQGMPSWWGAAADTLGIASFVSMPLVWWLGNTDGGLVQLAPLMLLGLGAAVAMVATLVGHRRAARATRYAYGFNGLHLCLHILRDATAAAPDGRMAPADLKLCLQEVLGAFAASFSLITGSPCRACIKVISFSPPEGKTMQEIPPGDRVGFCYARTFCRDFATARLIGHIQEGPTDFPVVHNTAFAFLFADPLKRCFFNNDLPQLAHSGHYQNSSVKRYGGTGDATWTLPYKSTIVWPVRRVTQSPGDHGHMFTGAQEILGYLTVDSPETNVFSRRFDFEVGALLADALYMFLDSAMPSTEAKT